MINKIDRNMQDVEVSKLGSSNKLIKFFRMIMIKIMGRH